MSTIGGRIKAARERADLTQGALAVACGWSDTEADGQSRVSNYERNTREPTLEHLRQMSKVLGVNPAELAFGHPLKPDDVEQKIIYAYRAATPQGRRFILNACESSGPDRQEKKRAAK